MVGLTSLLVIIGLFVPSSSLVRTNTTIQFILLLALIGSMITFLVFEYLKTSSLHVHNDGQSVLVKEFKSFFKHCTRIPVNKVRFVSITQKQWQRRFDLANVEVFSLGNASASIEIYSIPYKEAETLSEYIEFIQAKVHLNTANLV
jgi:membrane protein YdbS with pleckstrin-like domain